MRKFFAIFLSIAFVGQPIAVQAQAIAGPVQLPQAGSMVTRSPAFIPTLLRGVTIHPDDPLQFDFIVDQGDAGLQGEAFNVESQRMVNYFLAALTLPQKDVWVNLSPTEKDRIIPDTLIKTELGRELLAQDYILKQLTASLIYPEDELGKVFWARVYDQAYAKFGVTELPVDTFNKVWIVPEKASVVEKGDTVYIAQAHLKVMLESDYQIQQQALTNGGHSAPLADNLRGSVSPSPLPNELASYTKAIEGANGSSSTQELTKKILREIIVPAIEQEVNEGKNFAALRQVFYAMVLAQWYQDVFKESILNKLYAAKGKVTGIDLSDPRNKQVIYDRYMAAYQKGVFNFIKEETDRLTNEPLPRKYFSGGFAEQKVSREKVDAGSVTGGNLQRVRVNLSGTDNAAAAVISRAFYEGQWGQIVNRELRVYLRDLQEPGDNKVVSDVSLEAFLDPIKGPAQLALGKGGLGFLTGETWGAYSGLEHWKAHGAMPLYSFDKNDNEIDWDRQQGVEPVFVQDSSGRKSNLSFDVDFKGQKERVYIYWANANGTPVFLIKHKTIFRKLYPGGEEQIMQYGFFGKAYVELMKVLGVSPNILRLSEPQLIFVLTAAKNDIDRDGKQSPFHAMKMVMTTHTPEGAALPKWNNIEWLKTIVGEDLVRKDIIYAGKVNAAGAMAYHAAMINGVSPEHKNITQVAVLPDFADKTTGIQNGSEPYLWRSQALNDLILEKGISNVKGRELFNIGTAQKHRLNDFLRDHGFGSFDDIDRPMFAAVRRLVEYKSQAMFIPMMRWIVGDPDREYETPLGPMKGLGANVLFGGEALDSVTPEWMKEFKELEQAPDVKGKFIMAERTTGTQFMQLATSAADGWLVMPWMTREASGTSDHRAGFNGHLVIATATGGPLEWIDHGVNGWLVTPFTFEHFKRNTEHAAEFHRVIWAFQNKEVWVLTRFYEEGRRQFARYMKELVDMYHEPGRARLYKAMAASFQAAHRRVSIHRMVQEYGLMFDAVAKGEGVTGFERDLDAFGRNWEGDKLWQKEGRTIEFNEPVGGKPISLLMTLDGYDPLTVSLLKKQTGAGYDLVTPNGNLAVDDGSDIYIVRTSNQLRAMLKPPATGTTTMTRLRLQVGDKMRINVVRSGVSPIKITVKDNAELGGIDLQGITVDRQGNLIQDIMNDKAVEGLLARAAGLQAVIISVTPIADIRTLLR